MNPLFLLKDFRIGLISVTKAAIARCLDTFAPLRFGGGDWGYCRGGDRHCQQPPLYRACRKSLKPLQKKTLTGLNAPRVQAYELKSVKSLVQHHFRNVPKS